DRLGSRGAWRSFLGEFVLRSGDRGEIDHLAAVDAGRHLGVIATVVFLVFIYLERIGPLLREGDRCGYYDYGETPNHIKGTSTFEYRLEPPIRESGKSLTAPGRGAAA